MQEKKNIYYIISSIYNALETSNDCRNKTRQLENQVAPDKLTARGVYGAHRHTQQRKTRFNDVNINGTV